jgi:hypothetical protein
MGLLLWGRLMFPLVLIALVTVYIWTACRTENRK